jgi:hypothetical protein
MGKKAKLLTLARNAGYERAETQPPEKDSIEDSKEYKIYNRDVYNLDTAVKIQQSLIQYTLDGYYPLCDFLDLENVENFLQYLTM